MLVILTVAAVKRGATIFLVLLVRLGYNKVKNTGVPAQNVEAYHVAKFGYANAAYMRQRILLVDNKEMRFVSIILIMGPLSLCFPLSGENEVAWYGSYPY